MKGSWAALMVVVAAAQLQTTSAICFAWQWCEVTEVEAGFASEPESHPSWSAEERDFFTAVETKYERKISFPPLQGWWAKRNFSTRLFTQKLGNERSKRYLGEFEAGRTLKVYDMGSYVLAERIEFDDNNSRVFKQYFKDGSAPRELSRTTTGDLKFGEQRVVEWLPIPESTLALRHSCADVVVRECDTQVNSSDCFFFDDRKTDIPCRLEAIDVSPGSALEPMFQTELIVANKLYYDQALDYYPGYVRFVKHDGQHKAFVSDWNTSAFLVDMQFGGVEDVSASASEFFKCKLAARTSSSRVRDDGKYLVTSRNKVDVETSRFAAYSCIGYAPQLTDLENSRVDGIENDKVGQEMPSRDSQPFLMIAVGAGGFLAGVLVAALVVYRQQRKQQREIPDAILAL